MIFVIEFYYLFSQWQRGCLIKYCGFKLNWTYLLKDGAESLFFSWCSVTNDKQHAAYAMHSKSSIGIGHRYVSSQPTFAIKFTKLKDSANVCRFALAKLHTVQCTSTTSTCFTLIFSFYSPFLCVSFHNQHIKSLEKKKKTKPKTLCTMLGSMRLLGDW